MTQEVQAVAPIKRTAWNKGIAPKSSMETTMSKSDEDILAGIKERGLLPAVKQAAKSGNCTVEEICSLNRTARVQNARVAVYVVMREQGWSHSDIGRIFGRTHAAIHYALHGRKRAAKKVATP